MTSRALGVAYGALLLRRSDADLALYEDGGLERGVRQGPMAGVGGLGQVCVGVHDELGGAVGVAEREEGHGLRDFASWIRYASQFSGRRRRADGHGPLWEDPAGEDDALAGMLGCECAAVVGACCVRGWDVCVCVCPVSTERVYACMRGARTYRSGRVSGARRLAAAGLTG
jgi:hypothetical protein